ncbi:hypothetical protein YC2023_107306 [Brassica napus]
MGRGIDKQGVEGLSQASYVPDFDPSQTKKEDDWWTPMTSKENTVPPPSQWKKRGKEKGQGLQLSDSPLPQDAYPESSLYNISEESWKGFTEWEMNAVMFIWRVKTTLNRWAPRRVAFMSAMLCLQLDAAYNKFLPNKKSFQLPDFLLGYGIGELPSHGRTGLVWGVDVDRLYFPLFVNVNHSLLCTS